MQQARMNCKTANNLDLKIVLKHLGFHPEKETESSAIYSSPFRSERTASFKLSKQKNVWVDFGDNTSGGTVVDFIMRLKSSSVKEALEFLSRDFSSFSFQQPKNKLQQSQEPNNYRIIQIRPLKNIALLNYLKSRSIDLNIAKDYCSEVYYKIGDKKFFAIAFKNNSNGIEIRNKYFKGALNKKDITTISKGSNTVIVFEGFIDFISFLTLRNEVEKEEDFIILNSISLINKVAVILKKYKIIKCYLDNDEGGNKATRLLIKQNENVVDCSFEFSGFKDLNEKLMNNKNSGY